MFLPLWSNFTSLKGPAQLPLPKLCEHHPDLQSTVHCPSHGQCPFPGFPCPAMSRGSRGSTGRALALVPQCTSLTHVGHSSWAWRGCSGSHTHPRGAPEGVCWRASQSTALMGMAQIPHACQTVPEQPKSQVPTGMEQHLALMGCGERCWAVMLNQTATKEQPLNTTALLEHGGKSWSWCWSCG